MTSPSHSSTKQHISISKGDWTCSNSNSGRGDIAVWCKIAWYPRMISALLVFLESHHWARKSLTRRQAWQAWRSCQWSSQRNSTAWISSNRMMIHARHYFWARAFGGTSIGALVILLIFGNGSKTVSLFLLLGYNIRLGGGKSKGTTARKGSKVRQRGQWSLAAQCHKLARHLNHRRVFARHLVGFNNHCSLWIVYSHGGYDVNVVGNSIL